MNSGMIVVVALVADGFMALWLLCVCVGVGGKLFLKEGTFRSRGYLHRN